MQTKQMLNGKNGEELVYINLSFPEFTQGKLRKTADPFYKEMAKRYASFAEKRLLPAAKQAKNDADFKPFSAVMKCDVEETEKHISVTVHSFVFDGNERRKGKTVKQIWDKKTGLLL